MGSYKIKPSPYLLNIYKTAMSLRAFVNSVILLF